jgi:hypothetical protein
MWVSAGGLRAGHCCRTIAALEHLTGSSPLPRFLSIDPRVIHDSEQASDGDTELPMLRTPWFLGMSQLLDSCRLHRGRQEQAADSSALLSTVVSIGSGPASKFRQYFCGGNCFGNVSDRRCRSRFTRYGRRFLLDGPTCVLNSWRRPSQQRFSYRIRVFPK